MPLAGIQNFKRVLNASNINCNCRPCPNRTMKCLSKTWHGNPNEYLSIINFRGDHAIKTSTQRPYVHSPTPKCLCKQGTTNINIIIKQQKMSSTVIATCLRSDEVHRWKRSVFPCWVQDSLNHSKHNIHIYNPHLPKTSKLAHLSSKVPTSPFYCRNYCFVPPRKHITTCSHLSVFNLFFAHRTVS